MKYIDADKLIAEIERLKDGIGIGLCEYDAGEENGKMEILIKLSSIITSLQQEQPESTCKTCGFYENNCPFIRGKLIPYPNKVCKDYTYSAMKEQEQQEVDLKEEIASFFSKNPIPYEHITVWPLLKTTAIHFTNFGLKARKEEQL